MKEEWRPVVGFPGYVVSDQGRVAKIRSGGRKHIMRSVHSKNGYLRLSLSKEGKKFNCMPHRLVLEAFIGPCEDEKECDHINTIRDDNRLENLRWATRSENRRNPISRQRFLQQVKRKRVMCVETGEVFPSQLAASRRFDIPQGGISCNCTGKSKSAHGFHFKFV